MIHRCHEAYRLYHALTAAAPLVFEGAPIPAKTEQYLTALSEYQAHLATCQDCEIGERHAKSSQ